MPSDPTHELVRSLAAQQEEVLSVSKEMMGQQMQLMKQMACNNTSGVVGSVMKKPSHTNRDRPARGAVARKFN